MRVGTRWRAWRESPPRTHGLSQFERMARQAARALKTEARADARVRSQAQEFLASEIASRIRRQLD